MPIRYGGWSGTVQKNCAIPGECAEADFANADAVEVEVMFGTGSVSNDNGTAIFTAVLEGK